MNSNPLVLMVLNFMYNRLDIEIGTALKGYREKQSNGIDLHLVYRDSIEMIRLLKKEIKRIEGDRYGKN